MLTDGVPLARGVGAGRGVSSMSSRFFCLIKARAALRAPIIGFEGTNQHDPQVATGKHPRRFAFLQIRSHGGYDLTRGWLLVEVVS